MGDRPQYTLVYSGSPARYTSRAKRPTTVGDLADEITKWSAAWRQWASWVCDDIKELEARTGSKLAPPPPPPDPWP